MVFSGGMIPTFLLVKDLGLLNSYWALILPVAINPFSLIIIKNFFQQLPAELEESAKIDGANELGTLWRSSCRCPSPSSRPSRCSTPSASGTTSCRPCSTSTTARSGRCRCSCARSPSRRTSAGNVDPNHIPPAQGIKFAVIVVATLPILIFYPFLQKHFAKGMLIGSVKG